MWISARYSLSSEQPWSALCCRCFLWSGQSRRQKGHKEVCDRLEWSSIWWGNYEVVWRLGDRWRCHLLCWLQLWVQYQRAFGWCAWSLAERTSFFVQRKDRWVAVSSWELVLSKWSAADAKQSWDPCQWVYCQSSFEVLAKEILFKY